MSKLEFECKIEYICRCIAQLISPSSIVKYEYCATNDVNDVRRKPNVGMLRLSNSFVKFSSGNKCDKGEMLMIGDASGKK